MYISHVFEFYIDIKFPFLKKHKRLFYIPFEKKPAKAYRIQPMLHVLVINVQMKTKLYDCNKV